MHVRFVTHLGVKTYFLHCKGCSHQPSQVRNCAQNENRPMLEDIRDILVIALNTQLHYEYGAQILTVGIQVEEMPLTGMHCISGLNSLQSTCTVNVAAFHILHLTIGKGSPRSGKKLKKIFQHHRDVNITIVASYVTSRPNFKFVVKPNGIWQPISAQNLWKCDGKRLNRQRRDCAVELIKSLLVKRLPLSCIITNLHPLVKR